MKTRMIMIMISCDFNMDQDLNNANDKINDQQSSR